MAVGAISSVTLCVASRFEEAQKKLRQSIFARTESVPDVLETCAALYADASGQALALAAVRKDAGRIGYGPELRQGEGPRPGSAGARHGEASVHPCRR